MVLEEACVQTFRMMGLSVLSQPKLFLSSVLDLCDGGSRELKVFKRNCDDGLCSPFATVVDMPSPQIRDLAIAEQNAEVYLRDDRMISDEVACETSRCLARAVGRALGLPAEELASHFGPMEPVQSVDEPTQATMVSPVATTEQPQDVMPSPAAQAADAMEDRGQPVPAVAPTNVPAQKKRSALPWVLVGSVVVIGVAVFVAVSQFGLMGTKQSSNSSAAAGAQAGAQTDGPDVATAQVEVPPTTGLTLGSARVSIQTAGLEVAVEEEESNATPQTVLYSRPSEGTTVEAGSTVTLVVAKRPSASEPAASQSSSEPETPAPAEPEPQTSSEPEVQTYASTAEGYGPATFSSTSSMDDVWDLIPYFDHTPETVHTWMVDNGFWIEGCGRDCVSYLSEYGTQFVYEQTPTSPENNEGYRVMSASVDTPLQNGMPWSVMRVHFWGEGLDYAIDKCHLGGESWRGAAGDLSTVSSSYMLVGSDAPAARGSTGGYQWEAAYDPDSSFCTIVVRTG